MADELYITTLTLKQAEITAHHQTTIKINIAKKKAGVQRKVRCLLFCGGCLKPTRHYLSNNEHILIFKYCNIILMSKKVQKIEALD